MSVSNQANQSPFGSDEESFSPANIARGVAGAVLGGVVGYFLFQVFAKAGFYALVLPEVLVGVGCTMLAKRGNLILAIVCVVLALVVGVLAEWQAFFFLDDESLGYFLKHITESNGGLTPLAIGIGSLIAGFMAYRK